MFAPLGMRETRFLPAASLRPRIAPTEIDPATGAPFRGVVHDPTARYMGGVAGHAGVFSTAADLAKYAQMMLDGGGQLFSPLTVKKFTSPNSPPDQPILRGLGWDIDSGYSAPRGELFPIGSYGHTGFTGPSLWIDPASKTYIILMTNSVHPKGGKNLNPLRSKIATVVAAAFGVTGRRALLRNARNRRRPPHDRAQSRSAHRTRRHGSRQLRRTRGQARRPDHQSHRPRPQRASATSTPCAPPACRLTALFSPEHGLTGKEDRPDIADDKDPATGLPVRSLYDNGRNRLTPAMLRDVDVLVFDIQDAGARFYTYSCTMLYALEEAAKAKLPFYVLDRPNPVTGVHVEGPLLDDNLHSFTGCFAMPVRHGLTLGELATMANAERNWAADLHVVKMKNWQRSDWFDSTGLSWTDPSPNLRSLNAAALYDGLALLEASPNYSVGRGTDAPFEQIGADWIHGAELAQFLNNWVLPGVRVYPTKFQPSSGPFAGKTIEGVRFVILNREQLNSVRLGLDVAYALQRLYPGKINFEACRFLIGSREVVDALKSGAAPGNIEERVREPLQKFAERRRPYLLY